MAVITRYIIVRNDVELEKVFTDKKEAEAYDKMLDAADGLALLIKGAPLGVDINAETIDAIAIYLAKNAPEVTKILKTVKIISSDPKPAEKKKDGLEQTAEDKKKASASKSKSARKGSEK